MDVAAWLQSLGLEPYEPLFRANEIDCEVLPKLTSEDLREIGIVAIGHRRKLLAAIAALGTAPSVAEPAASREIPTQSEAERRQLTVMFCDLVGSTALSARLDPEDLSEVIAAYHRSVAEVLGGFDSFVSRYMGDGVLVYFGYPQAHEDDAVRAGLACVDVVSRLDVVNALDFCLSRSAEALLVEWGGDVLGANVPAFLTCLMARRTDLKVILAAADALGAMGAKQILAERRLAISLITGPRTDTPTMRERTRRCAAFPR